jgi:ATP-dependent exoDNAse (exonuclease V) alpha subunit
MIDNQLRIGVNKYITLNDKQYAGVLKINNWLKSNNQQFFVLSGYAGVGKTTIIKKVLDNYRRRVAVSAPTHKAKKVIAKATNKSAVTLHSILGLRPDLNLDDFNPNDPKFNPIVQATMDDYSFIIIDEASMINYELYELIEKESSKHRNIKILFMGDMAQIPPINEKESYVFSKEFVAEKHHLTKVERQKDDNPLGMICDNLRNNLTLEKPIPKNLYQTNINHNGEGIMIYNKKADFRKKLLEYFGSENYNNNIEYVKLIAWRNITVNTSNNIIRELIFNKKQLNQIEVGETLTAYKSVRKVEKNTTLIDNSADYQVKSVGNIKENVYGVNVIPIHMIEYDVNNSVRNINIDVVDHSDNDNLHLFATIHDRLRDDAKKDKKKWKLYYKFRRYNLLMVDIKEYVNGTSRPGYDVITKDLDYGYAITGHKSQGSTYEHVLILEEDIDINPKIKERNQIKYVALSRPRKTAIIFNQN